MEKFVHTLSKWMHTIAEVVLLIMMFWITFDVLGRWLFSQPIKGTVDFTEIGLSMVVFLSLAYTHLHHINVTIDFLVEKFSQRVQWVFEGVINVIIACVTTVVAWSLMLNAQRLLQSNTVTSDLYLPVYIFVIIAAFGTIVFALTAVTHVITYTKKAIKNESREINIVSNTESLSQEVVNSHES